MPSSERRRLGVVSIGVPYFDVIVANQHLVTTRAFWNRITAWSARPRR